MARVVGPVDEAALPRREVVIQALDNCYDPCCRERRISVVDMGDEKEARRGILGRAVNP